MALIEEVQDDDTSAKDTQDPRSRLNELVSGLTLPPDLLPEHANEDKAPEATASYRRRALASLKELQRVSDSAGLLDLPLEEQGDVFAHITRLYGEDDWTSSDILEVIDDLASRVDSRAVSLHLLRQTLRPLFSSSHPMLHPTTTRALSRPAGGPQALSDLHDDASQGWKAHPGWGSYNMLAFCCSRLPAADLPDHIGLTLPPTLMMIDDWEQAWRGRGAWVLSKWIGKIPPDTMKRMGMDKLLLNSLLHTLSLHPNPPLPHVLPLTLDLIERTAQGEKRAELLADVMDKAVLTAWMYAPSGPQGREVLVQTANDLERLCGVMSWGILRWMKTIIPNLLQPLSFPPTPAVIPHFEANLSALLAVLHAVAPTGRIPRWRGQILDVLSRLSVHLDEKEKEGRALPTSAVPRDTLQYAAIKEKTTEVFSALAHACPDIKTHELPRLLALDHAVFAPVLSHHCAESTGPRPSPTTLHAQA